MYWLCGGAGEAAPAVAALLRNNFIQEGRSPMKRLYTGGAALAPATAHKQYKTFHSVIDDTMVCEFFDLYYIISKKHTFHSLTLALNLKLIIRQYFICSTDARNRIARV